MSRWLLLMPLALSAAMCAKKPAASPTAAPPKPNRTFTLVVTSSVLGNLEPCGCSRDQRGGIAHAAAAIDAIRKEGQPVIVVDGGDRFFPSAKTPADPLAAGAEDLQARAMVQATRAMRYVALVLGARDAAHPSFFAGPKLPLLVGEDAMRQRIPHAAVWIVRRIGSGPKSPKLGLLPLGAGANAPELLATRARQMREAGATVIAAFVDRTFEDAKRLLPAAKAAGVSFVFATRSDDPETGHSAALTGTAPALFAVAPRGQEILRLDVSPGGPQGALFVEVAGAGERTQTLEVLKQRIALLRSELQGASPTDPLTKLKTDKLLALEGRRARLAASPPPPLPVNENAYAYSFVAMTPTLPKSPAVQAVIDQFHRDAAAASLAYLRAHPRPCPRARPGEATYVGAGRCASCHPAAFSVWKKTAHARAYQALVERGRQFDVACIGCHVVGYEKPGGACSIAEVKGRENVQCESCHGPGSLHAKTGDPKLIATRVSEATCRACHDPVNSPHFNFHTYLPQILGPGHGQPGRR